jgi:hypothetical protein
MSKLKTLLNIFILLSNLSLYAQNPFVENTAWATSERIDQEFEEITFRQIDPQNFSIVDYYQIHFLPDNKLWAFNVPGCGIDCVVQVYGNFSSTDTTTQFTINKILRIKGCSGDDTLKNDIGTYFCIKDKYSLRLVKNFADEPKENYFEKLNISFADYKGEEEKILEKYVYVYNRIYQIVANKNSNKYQIARQDATKWYYDEAKKYKGSIPDTKFYYLVTDLHSKLQELYSQIEPR